MASEMGKVARLNDIIPSGARIPVRTRTAAKGKKNIPKGISKQSKRAISDFSVQGNVALGDWVAAGTRLLISVTSHYDPVAGGTADGPFDRCVFPVR
jgi:hypothetical protein